MRVHRVMLCAGVAILMSLGVIVARSQGRAQATDAQTASDVSNLSAHPTPMTAAEIAELQPAVARPALREDRRQVANAVPGVPVARPSAQQYLREVVEGRQKNRWVELVRL
jgi:hypothetical protein